MLTGSILFDNNPAIALTDKNYETVEISLGDTLWKIAKKFRSTVEDIARVNGIEDENKIYVGQQLYIPKYIKKRI